MKVIITAWAEACLQEIYEYYSEKAGPEKAFEIVNKIIDKAETLETYANRGQFDEDLKELDKGHRYLLEYHYKIVYRIEADKVVITDIFSSWQDPGKKQERNK